MKLSVYGLGQKRDVIKGPLRDSAGVNVETLPDFKKSPESRNQLLPYGNLRFIFYFFWPAHLYSKLIFFSARVKKDSENCFTKMDKWHLQL